MSRLIDADELTSRIRSWQKIIKKTIDDAPTIDAEPIRHGHWKSELYQKQCSVCGGWNHDIGNYCPNCGAKMDEERKEE